MSSIEEELWNIFTYYALHGNPREPSRLNSSSLHKLCRDVMIMDQTMTEKPITQAGIHLVFTVELKNPARLQSSKSEKGDKINFEEFLNCLHRIAHKCYPGCNTAVEAMQQLLMDNILPLALRRKPIDVSLVISHPSIRSLFVYYEEALLDLFKFFALAGDQKAKGNSLVRTTNTSARTFDEQRELIAVAKEQNQIQGQYSHQMNYSEFIRFGNDFGLLSSLGLTTMDMGDIYLTVIAVNNFAPKLRKISFDEFWEALVRCSFKAFKEHHQICSEDKVKAMFLGIWKHIQSTIRDHVSGYGTLLGGGFNSYKGGLLRGAQILNERFIAAWSRDGFRDYLDTNFQRPDNIASSSLPMSSSMKKDNANAKVGNDNEEDECKGSQPSSPPIETTGNNTAASANAVDQLEGINDGNDDVDYITKLLNNSNTSLSTSMNSNMKTRSISSTSAGRRRRKASANDIASKINLDIEDDDDLGDERIKAADLRRLLLLRPDLAIILHDCIEEEGLVDFTSEVSTR